MFFLADFVIDLLFSYITLLDLLVFIFLAWDQVIAIELGILFISFDIGFHRVASLASIYSKSIVKEFVFEAAVIGSILQSSEFRHIVISSVVGENCASQLFLTRVFYLHLSFALIHSLILYWSKSLLSFILLNRILVKVLEQ